MWTDPKRLKATQMLVLGTACWGLSFPTMKALALMQQPLLPGASTWFIAALGLVLRFGIAALIMLAWSARTIRQLTWLEIWEGAGLGFFAAAGLIFQMDGLAHTSASTSAFLTQFYCLIIPVLTAIWDRRWPSLLVIASCLMVIAGAAVLSGLVWVPDTAGGDWTNLRLGRGEWETLVASVIFTGQILWLQRPVFARNNVNHFTVVMFAVIALLCLPVAALTTAHARDWITAYESPVALGLMVLLILFCTLGGYLTMNYWQPHVTATQAGLIYCVEPVFASGFALFLPAWLSAAARIDYPNETLTAALLLGGGLITVANVLIQLQPTPAAKSAHVEAPA